MCFKSNSVGLYRLNFKRIQDHNKSRSLRYYFLTTLGNKTTVVSEKTRIVVTLRYEIYDKHVE